MVETKIIDGKQIAKEFRENLAKKVQKLGSTPKLAVLVVGEHPASQIYVQNKKKAAVSVGIDVDIYQMAVSETQESILKLIGELNEAKDVDGILIQLPLPEHLDAQILIGAIAPQKDVDGLHPHNVGNMVCGLPAMISCTPLACLYLLKHVLPDMTGMNALVIGRSALVGKPLGQLLLQENCTVVQAHSKTKNLADLARQADIIVCAVGKPGLVNGNMIKDGAIVIDVGINRMDDGRIVGDVLFLEAMQKASYITPVPGGVGPMTIAMLLWNVVKAAEGRFSDCKELVLKK
ncbi:MAG: bifunctional 5,10-methylene-tetrahydrofolate dehydrogenase/5,10-methylene-tetrahydrofolate cyclohydrolase [Alphaproteobacteria bacterium]|nr:bifunctional 5,10-methylene-tetrahydrofolate dehydrogenase/5,10-methylene-tetrahydrofolate cyclohydrolase [Alphaproteobacteria bacterium]